LISNQKNDGKFLVNFLHSFTDKQIFFSIWAVIVGAFVLMLISYYRKQTRSNFRKPGDGPGPRIRVDQKRLDPVKSNLPAKSAVQNNRQEIKRRN
jgi:hypothetical protein